MPFNLIHDWLEQEVSRGCAFPNRMVLATAGKSGIPHCRIVAIKEIIDQSIVFFTQRGTRKVKEMQENPCASATIWLPLQQREIIFDGKIEALSTVENAQYWEKMLPDNRLRFSAYAPVSSKPIASLQVLEDKYQELKNQFNNANVPVSEFYCGYRLIPETMFFYTLGTETFSEVYRYQKIDGQWNKQQVSS